MPQPLHSASLAPAGQYASLLDDVRVEALLGGTIAREIRKLGNLGRVLRDHRRRHWMIDLGRKLRRRYLYTWNGEPFGRKAEAEAVLLQIRKNVAEGLDLEVAVAMILGEGAQENSVGSRIERWLAVKRQECKAGDISPTYLKELERWLAPGGYVGQWWSDKPITAINLTNIRDWATWLNRQETPRRGQDEPLPLSGKTRFNVHAAMHAFVAWLAEEDRRVRLPARWPWPSKGEPSILIISIETQDAILDAIPEEERGIFLSMAYLGIRPGEAVVLDVSDYRDGWLTISKARKGERLTSPVRGTKTGKVKRLPVPEEVHEWIERNVTARSRLKGGTLFTNPDAYNPEGRWSAAALRRAWLKACKVVGVKVGIYAGTKHAMATHLLSQGVQERHIQALLGHEDVRSTRRYAKLGDQALVEALRRRKRNTGV